jgi:hypothetical protein
MYHYKFIVINACSCLKEKRIFTYSGYNLTNDLILTDLILIFGIILRALLHQITQVMVAIVGNLNIILGGPPDWHET